MSAETITLEAGKYQVIFENGKFSAKRYGEEWRDLTGDKLILAMFQRLKELEAKI